MKNIRILHLGFLCFMLFNLSDARAQSLEGREAAEGHGEIKSLEIGDTIPEELWNMPLQVVNHPDGKDTITLNDYRDKKLIILDFWSTWCGACIVGFPKFIELQREFKDQIMFLPVTYQDENDIEKIIDTNSYFEGLENAVVINDQLLERYFPHETIPHVAWINTEGKLQGLTGSQHISELSIKQFLGGEIENWAVKNEDAILMDSAIVSIYNRPESARYDSTGDYQYSFLSTYTSGLPRYHLYLKIDTVSGYKVLRYANHSLYYLYMKALGRFVSPIHENLIVIESDNLTIDKLRYKDTGNQTSDMWYKANGWTYEIKVPVEMSIPTVGTKLIEDLNFYLGIEVYFEDRVRDCWVLKVTDEKRFFKAKSKGGDKVEKLVTQDNLKILHNVSVDKLVAVLNYLDLPIRAINEVEYEGGMDMEINVSDLLDIANLNQALDQYGLQFERAERLVNVLVFRDAERERGGK